MPHVRAPCCAGGSCLSCLPQEREDAEYGEDADVVFRTLRRRRSGALSMSLHEENAEVLRNMAAAGDDLRTARPMDFNHIFPTRAAAIAFARRVDAEGFTPVVSAYDKPGFPFDVTVTTEAVVPTCDFITATEQRLAAIAAEHDGRADGWGCLEQ
jgi:hypothetical protein